MSMLIHARRSLLAAAAGAAMIAATALSGAQAAGTDAKLTAAVEALRAAMVAGDGKALSGLVSDHLNYGHSDGHVQTKADFIETLAGKNAFKSIELTNQTMSEDGDVAWVRHVFDAVNNLPEGKTSTSHITVLQVWKRDSSGWKLFARQSTALKN